MNLGPKLKLMRKASRFTQQKVNDIMPWWSVSKLSRIENGHQEPTYTEYHELADFYQKVYKVVEFSYIRRDGGKPVLLLKRV